MGCVAAQPNRRRANRYFALALGGDAENDAGFEADGLNAGALFLSGGVADQKGGSIVDKKRGGRSGSWGLRVPTGWRRMVSRRNYELRIMNWGKSAARPVFSLTPLPAAGEGSGVRGLRCIGAALLRAVLLFSLFVIHNSELAPLCGAQQPQAQSGQPIYAVNAKYVQGVGPGYWPTAGSGLTLNLAAGTAMCDSAQVFYAGGTLTMAASATNYVYLDQSNNCAPASNTTGFTDATFPIAQVTTGASSITTVTDLRTWFLSGTNVTFNAKRFPGADMSLKIQAALAACPSTGCIIDARGFTGTQTWSVNFYTGNINTPVVVLLGEVTANVSAQIAPGAGQSLIGTVGTGFAGLVATGTVLKPVAGFTPASLFLIDPATNAPTLAYTSGIRIEDLGVDMTNVSTGKVVLQINSGEHLFMSRIRVVNNDGQFIVVDKTANVGAQAFTENVVFDELSSIGKGTDVAATSLIQINHGRALIFRNCYLTYRSAGSPNTASQIVFLNGEAFYILFTGNILAGAYKGHVVTGNASFSPGQNRFLDDYIEGYTFGYFFTAVSTLPALANDIQDPIFVSRNTGGTDINIGDYSNQNKLDLNSSSPAGGQAPTLVTFTANASASSVICVPACSVTDNNGTNALLNKMSGNKGFTLGAVGYLKQNITLVNGANNNVSTSGATFLRIIGPTAAFQISGFSGGVDGQKIELVNSTANTMTLQSQNAGSSVGNRIQTQSGSDYVVQGGNAILVYSAADNFWYLQGSSTANLFGTTGSIGGSALAAGACTSGTVSITGAATSMAAAASPSTYPGDGIVWDAQVTAGGTVTVKVCAIVALTPTASTYNVRVLQ